VTSKNGRAGESTENTESTEELEAEETDLAEQVAQDGDGEEGEVTTFEYVITYTNGLMRKVIDVDPPDKVQQRWHERLSKNRPATLMFPSDPSVQLSAIDSETGEETSYPTVIVRADLILDISETVRAEDEGGDDRGDSEEDELPEDPAPSGGTKNRIKLHEQVMIPGMR
jgi:hypothetical protein